MELSILNPKIQKHQYSLNLPHIISIDEIIMIIERSNKLFSGVVVNLRLQIMNQSEDLLVNQILL